jgi:phosphoglycerate dehydrogenase-like enzyme
VPKPKVFIVISGRDRDLFFTQRVRDTLASFADLIYNDREKRMTSAEFGERIAGCEAVITGWGSPKFTPEVLQAAKSLKIVSHAGGSVRFLMPDPPSDFYRRGVRITCATPVMSRYVAEYTLCLVIACLRRVSYYRDAMRDTPYWYERGDVAFPADTIFEQRIGMVGLGLISWEFVRLVKPYGCELWAYSKYGDAERAAAEAVKLVDLDTLLRECPIICLFAAVRPDTIGMISRERLKMIQDGAVFINTARGQLIDEPALIEELKTGRLFAGIDITYPEPPEADNPLRTLPNVLLSPHISGPTPTRYYEFAEYAVEELRRFFSGEPLRGEVTEKRLQGMA